MAQKIKIKVYTTPTCPFCVTLKEWLKEKNFEFEEIDVSSDEKERNEMISRSGQIGVPVVEINGEMIVGFDREKIVKALKIK